MFFLGGEVDVAFVLFLEVVTLVPPNIQTVIELCKITNNYHWEWD